MPGFFVPADLGPEKTYSSRKDAKARRKKTHYLGRSSGFG